MRHLRIAERLFNRPLMISEGKLNIIQHVFGQHAGIDLVGLPAAAMIEVSEQDQRRAGYTAKNGIGVIGMHGPLMHRVLEMEFPSGGPTTYADIRRAFDLAMADDAVQGIVLDIDSPGGEVNGCFDLADHIYQARGIKPITAVVNESAYSAAYLLASAADKIIIPRTGGAGSIGVIATHADFSQAEAAAGINVRHIYAGRRKADFSSHQPLSEEAEAVLQEMVNDSYDLFVDTVAMHRGMKVQAVRDTEAGIFDGQKAVAMKLADSVSAVDKAIASASKGKGTRLISATAKPQATGKENKMRTIEELREQHPDLVAQIETEARAGMIAQADADSARTEAVSTENERLMGLVSAAVGEETGSRIGAAAAKGLNAEDLQALGVDLSAGAGSNTQQQMLAAITAAAADGVKTGTGKIGAEKVGIDTASIYASRKQQLAG